MVAQIRAYFPRYPTKQAVTLPALHIVNEHLRYVPLQGGRGNRRIAGACARRRARHAFVLRSVQAGSAARTDTGLGLPLDQLRLRGGEEVLEHMCHTAGIQPGQTTPDGKLTLEFAECLGACEFAPACWPNKTLHKDLTTEKADEFLTNAVQNVRHLHARCEGD